MKTAVARCDRRTQARRAVDGDDLESALRIAPLDASLRWRNTRRGADRRQHIRHTAGGASARTRRYVHGPQPDEIPVRSWRRTGRRGGRRTREAGHAADSVARARPRTGAV